MNTKKMDSYKYTKKKTNSASSKVAANTASTVVRASGTTLQNAPCLKVNLTNVNLAKPKEVQLAIAKAKKEHNDNNPRNKMRLSDWENHLLIVNARWFRKLWRAIKRLLSWK